MDIVKALLKLYWGVRRKAFIGYVSFLFVLAIVGVYCGSLLV